MNKLLKAGFIKEMQYLDWIANVVMVKKLNDKWRIYIDYTYLNKAYPKDSHPLSKIDQLVDTTSGNELLNFMDIFSRYNHIKIVEEDQEKTAFVAERGLYCYKIMPFGLKNAGTTYQHLVNKVFKNQIGKIWKYMWMIC